MQEGDDSNAVQVGGRGPLGGHLYTAAENVSRVMGPPTVVVTAEEKVSRLDMATEKVSITL